jgi:flagellin-specific chaperone FliS
VDLGKTVTALSYAMNHKGGCNIAKRNLSEIYEYMDQVMRQKVKSKQKSNLEQHVDKSYNNGTYDSIPTRDN